ncbi:MAG: hypothetical protein ACKO8N_15010 [Rubrivivax sp.]
MAEVVPELTQKLLVRRDGGQQFELCQPMSVRRRRCPLLDQFLKASSHEKPCRLVRPALRGRHHIIMNDAPSKALRRDEAHEIQAHAARSFSIGSAASVPRFANT